MRTRIMILVAAAVFARGAYAGDDVVTLTSGNRMTGEIRELSRGQLEFSIDGVRGWSNIAWNNIESLESAQRFEIMLASGERITGTVASLSKGQLEIQTDAGVRAVAQDDVVFIRAVGATFTERLEGSIDLGLELLTAGDVVDWTLNAEATHRTRNYVSKASITSRVRESDNVTTHRRNYLDVSTRRLMESRWFVLGAFKAEEDRELDLDTRLLLGAAVGRTLAQSNRTTFAAYGGFDMAREEFTGLDADDVPEVLGAIEWDWFEIGGALDLLLNATTYYSLDESRVRFELDGSLRHDVFTNYYVALNVFESYNSDPPSGFEKSDFGVSISFGRSF